jgi:Notch-like protein
VPHEGSYTKMRITNSRRDYDLRIIVSSSVLLLFLVHTATGFISCSPSPCKNGGTCISSPKSDSFCNCTSKYVGEYCQHLNPCHTGPGPRCQNGGSCQVRVSAGGSPSFTCLCPLGFSASLCEIPIANSCDRRPCLNGGTCSLRSLEAYQCSCAPGYTGKHCEKEDHCASQPCRNGAECTSLGEEYKCKCAPGFTGPECKDDKDECRHKPCVHGKCHNTHGSYTCTCDEGYTGQNCESEYIPCDPSPCLNGGQCRQRDKHTYTCDCPTGFRGTNCEENIDDCPGHQCQNGGTCVDGISSYTCQCPPTYTGRFCTQDVDECSLRPSVCQNGATCTNSIGSFSCICVNGWTGPDCSVNIDDCAGAACFNGATCIDRVGSFYCRCTPGKTGKLRDEQTISRGP